MSWMSPLTVPMTTLPIRGAPGFGEQRPQDRHAGLHRVRGEQNLGHEQDAVAEVDADDAHPLDERVVEHAVGLQPRPRRMFVPSVISSAMPS